MVVYKIRDSRTEQAVKNLLTVALGKTPTKVVLTGLVDVTEIEFDAPLTATEETTMYQVLAKLDKRVELKVVSP